MILYRYNTFDELLDMKRKEQLGALLGGAGLDIEYEFEGFFNDDLLFHVHINPFGKSTFSVNGDLKEPNQGIVLHSIERAGQRIPYQCEFYPSTESQKNSSFTKIGLSYPFDIDVEQKKQGKFNDWFLKLLDDRILVPDTCIIEEHYLSHVLLPRLGVTPKIKIPRFVILELEALGNRNDQYQKRLVFSAFNEIRRLRLDYGASIFPGQIKADLLANFTNISSSRRADSFIRLEIWGESARTQSGVVSSQQMVLFTKDMIMACTASAEDIDTFYMSPGLSSRTVFDDFNISEIITELATAFGQIRIEKFIDEKHSLMIEGMWSGKGINDWEKNNLKWYSTEH